MLGWGGSPAGSLQALHRRLIPRKRALGVAAVFLILLAAPAARAEKVFVIGNTDEAEESEAQDVPLIPATPLAAETVDDVLLTVAEVSRPCLDPWQKPPRDRVWVCLLVTLYNLSEEDRTYGPEQFVVVTSKGELASPVGHIGMGDGLQSGVLPPGGALAGFLRFELLEVESASRLRFAPGAGREAEPREIPL